MWLMAAAATDAGPGHNAMAKMHAAKQSVRNLLLGAWSIVISARFASCLLCVTLCHIMCSPSTLFFLTTRPNSMAGMTAFETSRGARFWCRRGWQLCAAREHAKGPEERQKRAGCV